MVQVTDWHSKSCVLFVSPHTAALTHTQLLPAWIKGLLQTCYLTTSNAKTLGFPWIGDSGSSSDLFLLQGIVRETETASQDAKNSKLVPSVTGLNLDEM